MVDELIWKKRDVRGQHLVHVPKMSRLYVNPRLGHLKIGREPGRPMEAESVVLIAVNQKDIASTNQADILRRLDPWDSLPPVEGNPAYSFRHLRMVYLPDGLLFEDNLERRWQDATGEVVSEIIFPSRHVAASGQASLTLHPIGVPHLPLGEQGPYGGYGGAPPPPSTRLGPWWKMLLNRAKDDERVTGFDVSLEVTHHGPSVSVPCLFIEVGSTEATWGHQGAAEVLAHLLRDGLLDDSETGWNQTVHEGEVVLVTLGGGHYAPRASQLGTLDGVWLGHMLASYALPFIQTEDGNVLGTWRQSILGALASTREAFPGGDLVCSMDKKAFKGWQRQAIRDLLASQNVPLLTTHQIKERIGLS